MIRHLQGDRGSELKASFLRWLEEKVKGMGVSYPYKSPKEGVSSPLCSLPWEQGMAPLQSPVIFKISPHTSPGGKYWYEGSQLWGPRSDKTGGAFWDHEVHMLSFCFRETYVSRGVTFLGIFVHGCRRFSS